MNKQSDKTSYRASLPGILKGIAAIITAIGGLILILNTVGLIPSVTPTPIPTPTLIPTPTSTTGSISVSSTPSGASIYLDGNYQGTTPMIIKSIRADTHTIALKLTGYQDLSQTIRIVAGEIAYVSQSLTSIPTTTPIITPADQKTFTNSIGMEFVKIPAGEFNMGLLSIDEDSYTKRPVHHVTISKDFYLGKYEVTQQQWLDVMGTSPSYFTGGDLPVEYVSWDDVQQFIQKLNEKEGTNKYRLPSEAEWEYAARAGTRTRYFFGDSNSSLGNFAWYVDNSDDKTHPVGQKNPNSWGLYDMYGNVWEWIQDTWHNDYNGAPTDGSSWEGGDSSHVIRGGSYSSGTGDCESAGRSPLSHNGFGSGIGFRLLRDL